MSSPTDSLTQISVRHCLVGYILMTTIFIIDPTPQVQNVTCNMLAQIDGAHGQPHQ